ncbi:type II toxin-antitoxin system RelE/ParE family toxin [Kordia sp.]|uniref:type II toxin-antitoxin system RelE/ParE family toxin n=1 Tax=Kordia sp. TaxID=1965332 RepID=UPI003D6A274E
MLTDTAKNDLRNIKDYITQSSNKAVAQGFIKELSNKLKTLSDNSVQGSPRDWVSVGLRVFVYKERCFYFRIIDNKMIVLRILNVKQDVTAQIF